MMFRGHTCIILEYTREFYTIRVNNTKNLFRVFCLIFKVRQIPSRYSYPVRGDFKQHTLHCCWMMELTNTSKTSSVVFYLQVWLEVMLIYFNFRHKTTSIQNTIIQSSILDITKKLPTTIVFQEALLVVYYISPHQSFTFYSQRQFYLWSDLKIRHANKWLISWTVCLFTVTEEQLFTLSAYASVLISSRLLQNPALFKMIFKFIACYSSLFKFFYLWHSPVRVYFIREGEFEASIIELAELLKYYDGASLILFSTSSTI